MFEYIRGRLSGQDANALIIETGGFGFKICVSNNTMTAVSGNDAEIHLLLHPVYREDDITLYGFAVEGERELFRTLIAVSGIGPKAAMGMLSQFREDELIRYIINGDVKSISKAPGIGKKTAERIVLELKDKYKGYTLSEDNAVESGAVESMRRTDNLFNEAVNGLLGLGFPYAQASDLVERVIQPDMTIEAVLQQALLAVSKG